MVCLVVRGLPVLEEEADQGGPAVLGKPLQQGVPPHRPRVHLHEGRQRTLVTSAGETVERTFWKLSVEYLENIWGTSGGYLRYGWGISGFLENIWRISGQYLWDILGIYGAYLGGYLGDIWGISWECVGDIFGIS